MSSQEREDLVARLAVALTGETTGDGAGEMDSPNHTMTAASQERLIAVLEGLHPADIAEAMDEMPSDQALAVFRALDNTRAAEVLDELDPDTATYLLDHDLPDRIADLLDILPMDDAAEIVAEYSEASPEQAEALIESLSERAPEDAAEVRELLSYKEQTAGRLMTDKFVRLLPEMQVEEAFGAIRRSDPDVETLADLYVVERTPSGREMLYGVLSLRDLVRSEPNIYVRDIMTVEPISVTVDTDQEEVAQIISKYDFNAVPVLDRQGALAGIVTVDDVVDVLVEEQTEDALRQGAVDAGVMDTPYFSTPVHRVVRSRVTWLLLLFVGGALTTAVLGAAEGELDQVPALAIYIALLTGTGGNTGAQTVSTIIRGLALQEIRLRDTPKVLLKELGTGLLLGGLMGAIALVLLLVFRRESVNLAWVVALTIWAVCAWANVIAALVPLAARKFKVDPALVSAPLITTLVDATGLAIYLWIAKLLLDALR
ncbi:MAG: magnesium transporter [Armatimonadaceae bacterium]